MPAPKGFSTWSLDDVFDIDPPEYLLDYWLIKGGRTVVWGKYGSAKSLLALEWSLHLALGQDWNGYAVPEPIKVLYFYSEGASDLQHRLAAWAQAHGFYTIADLMRATGGRLQFLGVDPDQAGINMNDEGARRLLAGVVEKLDPGLLVFDPIAKLWPGLNHNDEDKVGNVLNHIDEIRGNRAALIVDHARKDQTSFRGVTTLADLTDIMASMGKNPDATVTLEITPTGDGHKHKFRDPNTKVFFSITPEPIGPSIHPKLAPGYGVWLKHMAAPVGPPTFDQTVLTYFVPGVEMGPKDVKDAMGIQGTQVDNALSKLVDEGYLTKPAKGRYLLTEKGESALTVSAAVSPSGSEEEWEDLDDYAA